MTQLMAACADEHPRLAATFYTAGRGKMVKRIAMYLKGLTECGVMSIKDPELAAEQLMASWLGMSKLRTSPRGRSASVVGRSRKTRPLRNRHVGASLVDSCRDCQRRQSRPQEKGVIRFPRARARSCRGR